ncbi:MAG: hypothetical protein QOJ81_1531 [Chloroflexota bacterium]|jgi:hypothetical protein|nr:hypothetical protein [Chloroflexota bacterium]
MRSGTQLRLVDARSSDFTTLPTSKVEEQQLELRVSRDERLGHATTVRQHIRAAMRALSDGRLAMAGMWLVELDRLNEREATRARSVAVAAGACPDLTVVRSPGHGRAA